LPLKLENTKLRNLVEGYKALYKKAIDSAVKKIEDLTRRIEETLNLILKVIPPMLEEDDRIKYINVVYPKVRTLWGGGNE
jgi:cell division septal protein FtsQ